MKICVIGGGIIGLTSAYLLGTQGHQVTVLESLNTVGSGTSKANGAQLSYSYVQPLATPSVLADLPGYLFNRQSPLRFLPALDLQQWSWCFRFLLACNQKTMQETTINLLALAQSSRALFDAWSAPFQNEINFQKNGKLVLYSNAKALANAEKQISFQAQYGCQQYRYSKEECLKIEPALAQYADHFYGAVWTPDECVADSFKVCQALARSIEQTGGKILCNTQVLGFEYHKDQIVSINTSQGRIEADYVVVANGSAVNRLLRPIGLHYPVYPLKGYSITLPLNSLRTAPTISITDAAQKIVYAPLGDQLRVAGMAEIVGFEDSVDPTRIHQLLRATEKTFGLKNVPENLHAWCGLRPATPTSMPIVQQTKYKNLFINAGHGALGFTLAFGTAHALTTMLPATP